MIVATHKQRAPRGPLSEEELARNLARAREQDARIAATARRRRRTTAELAYLLRAFDDEQLYRALSYGDIGVYAVEKGYLDSERLAHDLVRAVRKLDDFPRLREVFRAGETFVSKVLRVLPHVTKANEEEFAGYVKKLSSRQLEAKLREAEGLATPFHDEERRTYHFTREGAAFADLRVQAEIRAARELGIELTPTDAAERIFRGSLLESSAINPAPPWRMVIHACECGDKAWVHTREGPVPVSPQTLNEAARDAVVADVTNGPMEVTNTIPPKIRNYVHDRDQGRCRAPGCKNMGYLHVHHEPGRKVVGHDPEYMLLTCTRHHPDRHAGRIYIRGSHSTGFRWFLFDGTELHADPDAAATVPPLPRRVLEADLLLARAALRRQRLTRKAAAVLIERAHAALEARREVVTVKALVTEARRLHATRTDDAAPRDAGPPTAAERAPEELPTPAASSSELPPVVQPAPELTPAAATASDEASAPEPAPAPRPVASSDEDEDEDEPPARDQSAPAPAPALDQPPPATAPDLDPSPPAPAPRDPDALHENLLLARRALTRLEVKRREAARLVERAWGALQVRGEECTVGALVQQALRFRAPAPTATTGVDSS